MNWVLVQIKENSLIAPSQQQSFYLPQPPPYSSHQNLQSNSFDLNSMIRPSILLIIIILAIIFFISGLLHLLIRFLLRPQIREPEDSDNVTVLQGQLQQLFHLHDAGVDQSFIDTLPVFHYKAIIGLKNPFDCAVCLCEFESEDKLRLLPICSHAFHMECIDTWLLSHSTCPLCRANLLHDFSTNNTCSPIVLVLESGSESSREFVTDNNNGTSSVLRTNSQLGFYGNSEFGSTRFESWHKSFEVPRKCGFKPDPAEIPADSTEKVVSLKLGKLKNINVREGSSSNSDSNKNADNSRRCFSMGSFEYIMDEDTLLQVPVTMNKNKHTKKKPLLPVGPGHRPVKSVCDCESIREFKFNRFESIKTVDETKGNCSVGECKSHENDIVKNQKESFSVSKIWLRGKKEKEDWGEKGVGRRAFSFRFPVNPITFAASDDDLKEKNANGELGSDNFDSLQEKTPSFPRRTMFWLLGRQNRVVHSSFTSNV